MLYVYYSIKSFSIYFKFEFFESILCEFYIYDKEFENAIDFVGDLIVN